ncbi:hypothetical protein VYU27_007316 [Nannochloropsis oceanica]
MALPPPPTSIYTRPSLLCDVDDDDSEQQRPSTVWSPSSRVLLSAPSPSAPLFPADNLHNEGQDIPLASSISSTSSSSTAPFSSLLGPLPSLDEFLLAGEVGVEEDGCTASKLHPVFTFGDPDRSHPNPYANQHQHSSSCGHHHRGHDKDDENEGEGRWAEVFDLNGLEAALPPAQPGVRAIGPADYKYRHPPPRDESRMERKKERKETAAAANNSQTAPKRSHPRRRDAAAAAEGEDEEEGEGAKDRAAPTSATGAPSSKPLLPGFPFVDGPAKQDPSSLESLEAELVRMLGPEQREALRLALDDELMRTSILEGRDGEKKMEPGEKEQEEEEEDDEEKGKEGQEEYFWLSEEEMRATDLTEPARAFSDDGEDDDEERGMEGEKEEVDMLRAVDGSVQVAPDLQARAIGMGGKGEEMMRRVKEGMEAAVARMMQGQDEEEGEEDEFFDR